MEKNNNNKILILYHSGPGSTKTISEVLAKLLKEKYEVDIKRIRLIDFAYDLIYKKDYNLYIFATPTHTGGPSRTILEFIDNINSLKESKPAYMIATYAVTPARSLHILAKKLSEKNFIPMGYKSFKGAGADAIAWIPSIFTFTYKPPNGYLSKFFTNKIKIKEKFKQVLKEIDDIIIDKKPQKPIIPDYPFYITDRLIKLAKIVDKKLYGPKKENLHIITDKCINCKICINICARGCYTEGKEQPIFNNENCEFCLGCIHNCPENAITYLKEDKSIQKPRFEIKFFAKRKKELLEILKDIRR